MNFSCIDQLKCKTNSKKSHKNLQSVKARRKIEYFPIFFSCIVCFLGNDRSLCFGSCTWKLLEPLCSRKRLACSFFVFLCFVILRFFLLPRLIVFSFSPLPFSKKSFSKKYSSLNPAL